METAKSLSPTPHQLLGMDDCDIDKTSLEQPIHRKCVDAVKALKADAAAAGFDLCLASAYRSFERQCSIFNGKALGERPLLDSNEKPIQVAALQPVERLFAILRWSALPGTSRHHWGTDFDVFDAASLKPGESFSLTVAETQKGGVFENFYSWLNDYLAKEGCEFLRPYAVDRGGVAPEPWHLSYWPLASSFEHNFSKELYLSCAADFDFELKPEALREIDEVFGRFIVGKVI